MAETQLDVMERLHGEAKKEIETTLELVLPKFEFFSRFYTEEHRAYHNFDHIKQMLDLLQVTQNEFGARFTLADTAFIKTFIWWHDIIYDPSRKDNEWTSAELFEMCTLEGGGATDYKTRIYDAIMDSRHLVKPMNNEKWSLFCLDLDLSAMIDKVTFTKNRDLIRKEFSRQSDLEFYKGRQKFFELLYAKPKTFYNPYNIPLFTNGEKSVRSNIQQELAFLATIIRSEGLRDEQGRFR